MASGSKKRRTSKSPSREAASKRARRPSTSASVHSHQADSNSRLSRHQSMFRGDRDPYLPNGDKSNTTVLPTSDDWIFRVKVISSSADLTNDVFKNAVQGLVRICFPEGVLDQLGIQVLEQHMREENAPQENIERMIAVFRSEMIHRVTWMLSDLLDTPTRLEAGVKSVIAASSKLHGHQLGRDILGNITDSLVRLRDRVPRDSTERLAEGTPLRVSQSSETVSENETNTASSSDEPHEEEPAPLPKMKTLREKKHTKGKGRDVHRDHVEAAGDSEMMDINTSAGSAEPTVQSSKRPLRENRDKKISSTWRWDIDTDSLVSEDVPEHFKKTSDLFAYHALPIARKKLGLEAKKKEIRYEIQNMLAEMQDDEYDKWVESLQKLLNGDGEMLIRPEPDFMFHARQRTAATPAPIDTRRQAKKAAKNVGSSSKQDITYGDSNSAQLQRVIPIKRETNADLSVQTEIPQAQTQQQDSVAAATTALRDLSTEERDLGPLVKSVETLGGQGDEALHTHQAHRNMETVGSTGGPDAEAVGGIQSMQPNLVNFLWPAAWNLDYAERSNVVSMVMEGLDKHVSVDSVKVSRFDGTTRVQTKQQLKMALYAIRSPGVKGAMERNLVPWMLANPSAFPDFLDKPIFFTHMMPYVCTTLTALCGARVFIDNKSQDALKTRVFDALQIRGISKLVPSWTNHRALGEHIEDIFSQSQWKECVFRGVLEKVLRDVAFAHREKFRDLKKTTLVRLWERETGQKW